MQTLFKKLKMADIDPPTDSVRMSIDPDYIQELADSMREQGLLQSILVRPTNGRFEIIAGHRRFLAATRLGWVTISCSVRECTENEASVYKATENLNRVDLTPIEEAKAYRDILDNHAMTIDQLSTKTGKTPGLIKRRLDLLKMPPELQKAIHSKQISYSVAEELWRIEDDSARNYYLSFAVEHGVTRDVAKSWYEDHAKSLRSANNDIALIGRPPLTMSERPVYLNCDCCNGPVRLGQDKILRFCPECLKEISKSQYAGQP